MDLPSPRPHDGFFTMTHTSLLLAAIRCVSLAREPALPRRLDTEEVTDCEEHVHQVNDRVLVPKSLQVVVPILALASIVCVRRRFHSPAPGTMIDTWTQQETP
jgi:hypothetical protein